MGWEDSGLFFFFSFCHRREALGAGGVVVAAAVEGRAHCARCCLGARWPLTPLRVQFLAGPAEIPENEITYDENDVLGKGTFGKVYRGRCRAVDVAVKGAEGRPFVLCFVRMH